MERHAHYLKQLARAESLRWLGKGESAPESAMQLVGRMKVLVPLGAFINKQEELARIKKEIDRVEKELTKAKAKLANAGLRRPCSGASRRAGKRPRGRIRSRTREALTATGTSRSARRLTGMTPDEEVALRARLEEHRLEHRALDAAIEQLGLDPGMDQLQLRRLKKRKLALKDIIDQLESKLIPDQPA